MFKNASALKTVGLFVGGFVLGGIITAGGFLSQRSISSSQIASAVGAPLFVVDGQTYSSNAIPSGAKMEYYFFETEVYNGTEQVLKQLALRIALAKEQKKDISQDLPTLATLLNIPMVSEQEAKQYFDMVNMQGQGAIFQGRSFEQIKAPLMSQMNNQKVLMAAEEKINEYTNSGRIKIIAAAPVAPPVQINTKNYPARGNAEATTTFVEVSDYLCPHCREVEEDVEKAFLKYQDKIKFVQVSYSLDPQGLSGALARGAFCAFSQGPALFWEYHKEAFRIPYDKRNVPTGMNPAAYYNTETIEVAKKTKLDATTFQTCLVSPAAQAHIDQVAKDFDASRGFKGTPTFYLNDTVVSIKPTQLEATLEAALAK